MFFLVACFFAGFYAIGDWLFFNATNDAGAFFAAVVSLTSVTLTELFLLLFTLVYIGRMRRAYWFLPAASGAVLLITWSVMIESVLQPTPDGLYIPVFNPIPFAIFIAYILAFGIGGIANLYRLHNIIREHSRNLARRTRGLVVVFTLVLILGLATNGYLGLTRDTQVPPPFSTLLLVVAGATMYTLYPGGRERVSEAIRRFKARRYDIKGAFLIYQDGTLIGSMTRPGEKIVDQDLFSATLDVIQNFMRTSFPGLRGKWLKSISHGDYTLVMERGRFTYLVVVLQGEESDQLRRQMRDLLTEFEIQNGAALTDWRGVSTDAVGIDDVLLPLLEEKASVVV